jgi:serine O-acetyltransferase
MHSSLSKSELSLYIDRQISNFFPNGNEKNLNVLNANIDFALQRIEYCFSKINNKYFFDGNHSIFNHLNGDQYAIFLYYLSNTLFRLDQDSNLCSKLYLLNKSLHGLDAFYEVQLPDIFMVIHPISTVLGRGKYDDYFLVYQRCGIGSNHNIYPKLGKYVTLHPGASVLGNSTINNYCAIASESLVIDKIIDSNQIYIGNPKSHTLIENKNPISQFWK